MSAGGAPAAALGVATRRGRRRALAAAARQLLAVRDAEERYLSRVPGGLCGAASCKAAEHAVSALDEIIDMLGEVYG